MEREPTRAIINANIGVTNIANNDVVEQSSEVTLTTIEQTLGGHSGPYGRFAMIINPNLNEPKFTKDGLNIIDAMEFMAPMDVFTKDLIRYIGHRIEALCGDGTTSSMIIAAHAINKLREYVVSGKHTYAQLIENYKSFVDTVCDKLVSHTITVDMLEESGCSIRNLVIAQALTSSHGNIELAELVANLFETTPKFLWKNISYRREDIETKTKYRLVDKPCDTTLKGMVFNNFVFNTSDGLRYEQESVRLLMFNEPLLHTGETIDELRRMERDGELEKPVCILVSQDQDNAVRAEVDILLRKNSNVAIFYCENTHPVFNPMNILKIMGGHSYNSNPSIVEFPSARVMFNKGDISIGNISGHLPTKDGLRIGYDDPTSKIGEFTVILQKAIALIHGLTEKSKSDLAQLSSLNRYLNMLVTGGSRELVIGGSSFENTAEFDVVEDVLKAVIASLEGGVMYANYHSLQNALTDIIKDPDSSEADQTFAATFILSIGQSQNYAMSNAPEIITPNVVYDVPVNLLTGDKSSLDNLKLTDIDPSHLPPVQPADMCSELLSRVGDVSLKLLFTTRIIAPGSVYSEEHNKPKD
mgnify:CR=1 FL=1